MLKETRTLKCRYVHFSYKFEIEDKDKEELKTKTKKKSSCYKFDIQIENFIQTIISQHIKHAV